jgi:hypothetical protein
MAVGGGSGRAHAAIDAADMPVSEPAAPPVPVIEPRLAEAAPAPSISATPFATVAPAAAQAPKPTDPGLDEEQKKKDKKKRLGPVAPTRPSGSPDYGI